MWLCSNKILFTDTEVLILYHFHVSQNIVLNKKTVQNVKTIFSWRAVQNQMARGLESTPCSKPQLNPRGDASYHLVGLIHLVSNMGQAGASLRETPLEDLGGRTPLGPEHRACSQTHCQEREGHGRWGAQIS